MRYVLGVDGGQTSTLAVVASESGTLLGAGRGGPSNHVAEPGGPERLRRALAESITGALERAGLRGQTIAAACFGMTGGGSLVPSFLPEIAAVERIRVGGDAPTALAGGTAGRPGVVVIAGTGSAAYGQDEAGREVALGGWGYVMGDEGSGYDVAIRALRAATAALDGRRPPTLLSTAIPAHYGLADLRALHRLIYSGQIGRPSLAEIARVVGEAADAGDLAAREILAGAGEDLAVHAAAVLDRLGALGRDYPVVLVGGVFRAGEHVAGPLRRALAERAPLARVQPPELPPVVGAVILALRELGIPLDPARRAELARTAGVAAEAK